MAANLTASTVQFTDADLSFVPAEQRAFAVARINRPIDASAHGTTNKGEISLAPVDRDIMTEAGKGI